MKPTTTHTFIHPYIYTVHKDDSFNFVFYIVDSLTYNLLSMFLPFFLSGNGFLRHKKSTPKEVRFQIIISHPMAADNFLIS